MSEWRSFTRSFGFYAAVALAVVATGPLLFAHATHPLADGVMLVGLLLTALAARLLPPARAALAALVAGGLLVAAYPSVSRLMTADDIYVDLSVFLGVAVVLIIDEGRLRRRETELDHARAAQEAERVRATLLASYSHSLKTPLAAAIVLADVLQQSQTPLDAGDVASLVESLHVLDSRVGTLLDAAMLREKNWEWRPEWNDIVDLCSVARDELLPEQRSRVTLALPADLPLARFDFVQMLRVLEHLLENALSYSPQGSSVVLAASADLKTARLIVEDSGGGFGPGAVDAEEEGRPGLGLQIANLVVEQHHGRLLIEPRTPIGTRVVVEFPVGGMAA